jgi:hypothetical protein
MTTGKGPLRAGRRSVPASVTPGSEGMRTSVLVTDVLAALGMAWLAVPGARSSAANAVRTMGVAMLSVLPQVQPGVIPEI